MQNSNPKSELTNNSKPSAALASSQILPAWAEGWLTIEDLQRMSHDINTEGALELKEFLPELQAIVGENQDGQ